MSKQWIEYRDLSGRVCWAELDFFAVSDNTDNIVLVELKLRHTRDAFKQLGRYTALLGHLYPNHIVSQIEVCRYFDPDEFKTTLLSGLRPHDKAHAAVVWEPPTFSELNG